MLLNRKIKVLLLVLLCLIASESQGTTTYLNDGQHHIIDYDAGSFEIDISYGDILGTTLEIIQGGKCGVVAGNIGKVILNGGVLTGISAEQNSEVTFLSGTLNNRYRGVDNSHLEMTGGTINVDSGSRGIWLRYSSTATVSGGTINGTLAIWHSSALTFVGSDFAINGVSVDLYEDIKNYATYEAINGTVYGYTGTITGTLSDGSSLNCYFSILDDLGASNANIYLIPEPCTIALLGLGGLAVLRRRRVREDRKLIS